MVPLRPLGLGEILDGAVSYIRAHPAVTLGLSAIVITITQLIQVPLTYLLLDDLASAGNTLGRSPAFGQVADRLAGSFSATAVGYLLAFVATTILTGLLIDS